jgi:hypothetical protein
MSQTPKKRITKKQNSPRCSTTNSFYQYILPWNQTHLGIHINERGTEKSATVRRSKNGFKNILCGEIRRNLNAETTSGIMPIQYECHPYAYVYTAIRASELLLHFATHSKPQEQIDWIEFIKCLSQEIVREDNTRVSCYIVASNELDPVYLFLWFWMCSEVQQ